MREIKFRGIEKNISHLNNYGNPELIGGGEND